MILSLLNQSFSKNFIYWTESVILFAVLFSVGFIFKKYVAKFVQNILSKIGFVLDGEIATISRNYISFWFFLIALYAAFLISPINNTSAIIHKLFYGFFAFSVVVLIASLLSKLLSKSISEKIGTNIIKFGIILLGLALILNQIGVKLTPIWAALGLGSLPVALALQDTLANFFAGVNIIASKQILRGDYIKIDEHEGTIIEINWRTTLIKEMFNAVISVPNSKLLSSVITSFHLNKSGVSALVKCGVAYGSDLERVEKIAVLATQEVIDKYDDCVKTFAPIVRFTDFADSAINFNVIFRVKNMHKKYFLQSEAFKNLYKKFNEEGIEIPYPQRVVTFNNKR
ncbi:MAG: mechanosensitive ion channel family protein [Endomicrobium sp.]|jgi:small-conductance mechanosensitive channel|nr:mechanosensitive ion channel family protein [Endomicrobium sp.]